MNNDYDSEFGRNNNNYLNEYIRFADTKAGILLAIEGGFLVKLSDNWSKILSNISGGKDLTPIFSIELQLTLLVIATIIMLLSTIATLWVIIPRLGEKSKRGYIFWENIAEFPSAKKYVEEVFELSKKELDSILLEQNYYLARTAKRKYRVLRLAFILGSIAILINIPVIVFCTGL